MYENLRTEIVDYEKNILFALAAVMLLSLGACSEGTVPAGGEEAVGAAADTDELSERVGFEMSVPATAKMLNAPL